MNQPLKHIAICGSGLASVLCVLALVKSLPEDIDLTLISDGKPNPTDVFFGTTTSATIYDFFLNLGITEPILLPGSNTSFSLGTKYANWGASKAAWMQSLHRPLPMFQNVGFHHYLARLSQSQPKLSDIGPYIMSAVAAERGVFAHPTEDKKTPLSAMEYGYHFLPKSWVKIVSDQIEKTRIKNITSGINSFEVSDGAVRSVILDGGKKIDADLFIDCTGTDIGKPDFVSDTWVGNRRLGAIEQFEPKDKMESICRHMTGADYGWQSETTLQDGVHHLTIYDPADEEKALAAHGEAESVPVESSIGYMHQPWESNYLAFGHKAATLEPLSPAPIMMLERDIKRLIELIPVSTDLTVERREYNRRFNEDYDHTSAFHSAFFPTEAASNNAYWQNASTEPVSQKLTNKITQFESRGTVVQYDLEPFEARDWMQLHLGLGRNPKRYDPLADKINEAQLIATLKQIRAANDTMAKKLPPVQIYMNGLLNYLRKQYG